MAVKKPAASPDSERVRRLREHLVLLRGEIELAQGQPFAVVQLVAQERATLAEIDALVADERPKEKSQRDQLAERRAARQANRGTATEPATSARGGRKPRSG